MGQEVKLLPVINLRKYNGCKMCISACKHHVLDLIDMNPEMSNHGFFRRKRFKAIIKNPLNCTGCEACISVCRRKAIEFKKANSVEIRE